MIAARCPKCGTIGCSGDTIFCDGKTTININHYSIEQQVNEQIQHLRIQLLKLDKYDAETCERMDLWENGIYVKLEDVLNLFSAKKE